MLEGEGHGVNDGGSGQPPNCQGSGREKGEVRQIKLCCSFCLNCHQMFMFWVHVLQLEVLFLEAVEPSEGRT